jgi:conserved oligomeric Golgi complex subunit 4
VSEELKAVESSACNKIFEDLLSTYYTPLEVWYMRSAVDKVLPFLYVT